jgi:hypothetical protein
VQRGPHESDQYLAHCERGHRREAAETCVSARASAKNSARERARSACRFASLARRRLAGSPRSREEGLQVRLATKKACRFASLARRRLCRFASLARRRLAGSPRSREEGLQARLGLALTRRSYVLTRKTACSAMMSALVKNYGASLKSCGASNKEKKLCGFGVEETMSVRASANQALLFHRLKIAPYLLARFAAGPQLRQSGAQPSASRRTRKSTTTSGSRLHATRCPASIHRCSRRKLYSTTPPSMWAVNKTEPALARPSKTPRQPSTSWKAAIATWIRISRARQQRFRPFSRAERPGCRSTTS